MANAPSRRARLPTTAATAAPAPMVAVRVPKTGEIVADQIRRRIVRGELREGDFLPSEAELIDTLGVSRPTLREALRVLEAEQLISVGRGSRTGAQVHRPKVASVARYAGFALQAEGTRIADVYDARLAIEPFVVADLASRSATRAADRLDQEIARLAGMVDAQSAVDFMIGVADFHRVLVEMSGNNTLLLITRMLQQIVARYQVKRLELHKRTVEEQARLWATGLKSFRKLTGLIRAGDAEKAAGHWRTHLETTNKVWLSDGAGADIIDVFD